ncbi:MAG: carbon-nitrogen hydrolase family protein [Lentisphaeria bacterium]|nr:carbon-nitrogen hydrolase family protein [Lentisphaeria bacterium]NQZ67597.1 carbon-nitrogen hydrolase family protein [Lentisphaeria bacterium]
MSDILTVALCQFNVIPGNISGNLQHVQALAKKAADIGAQLIVFPEVALSDYYLDDFSSMAAAIPGEQSDIISQLAKTINSHIAIGLVELDNGKLYNTAILVSPAGEIVGKYRKTHLSVDTRGGTIKAETEEFGAGEELPVFETELGTIAMMICKDGDYPEVARVLAVKGAEIILWLTNRAGVNTGASVHYAHSNCSAVITSNRSKGHALGGGSIIVDCSGKKLVEANEDASILHAGIDMDNLREKRKIHWEETRVRRAELYGTLGRLGLPVADRFS